MLWTNQFVDHQFVTVSLTNPEEKIMTNSEQALIRAGHPFIQDII